MPSVKIIFLPSLLIISSFFNSRQQNDTIPKDAVKGDFNGDGKPEYIWVVKPKINKDGVDCAGKCSITITCSNPAILPVTIENAIGGTITNLGDLNDDGKDEIGILPDWFHSCWHHYHIYTLTNKHWQEAVPSFPTHCNQWDAGLRPIERAPGKKGYVLIRYSIFKKDSIMTESKIIPIH